MKPSHDSAQKCAIVVLTSVVIGLLFMLRGPGESRVHFKFATTSNERYKEAQYTYLGKDFPPELQVHVPQIAHTFLATHRYGLSAEEDWQSLFTRSNGYVRLGTVGQPFALAMFHQLHCLDGLRVDLKLALSGNTTADSIGHIDHCLDYLRQSVLCCSDTSLEATERVTHPDGSDGAGATGLGAVHMCRDWSHVRNYVEDNYDFWMQHAQSREPL